MALVDGSSRNLLTNKVTSKEQNYDEDNIDENNDNRLLFYLFVILAEGFAIASVILAVIWADKYLGGFAWDGSGKMFNYHPVFMIIGMVFLYGNAAISYRVLRYQPKFMVKLIHASLHFSAFIFTIFGLIAVFRFHNNNNIPNLYSLHSWVGISTVVLFSMQFLFGFLAFLFPRFTEERRGVYLKVHVYFGAVLFALVIVACISGITEKMLFSFAKTYSSLPSAGIIANSLGVTITIFAFMVAYILYNPSYRRVN